MIKLIIVEDDAIVRKFMNSIINWNELGVDILGSFENGRLALDYIEKNRVDIVITDIGMPVMNGIELIQNIRDKKLYTKILVLTCHSDYDYIREALKCGVCDYLLKQNIDKTNLEQIILKIINDIGQETTLNNPIVENMVKSNFIKSLAAGILHKSEDAISYLYQYDLIRENSCFIVSILKIGTNAQKENDESGKEQEIASIVLGLSRNSINRFGLNGLVDMTAVNEYTFFFAFTKLGQQVEVGEMRESEIVYNLLSEISHQLKTGFNIEISAAIGDVYFDLPQVFDNFLYIKNILEGNMFFNKNIILKAKSGMEHSMNVISFEEEKILIQTILNTNMTGAMTIINLYMGKLQRIHDMRLVKNHLIEFLSLILRIGKELDVEFSVLFPRNENPYLVMEQKQSLDEVKSWFTDLIAKIIDKSSEGAVGRIEVLKVTEYISSHYDEEITLKDMASLVNISPNYLSTTFKREMGTGFSEYLINYRLEKSKELLNDVNLKVYEIAFKVGFSSTQYFNSQFKRKYGVTPLTFKKNAK